MKSELLEPRLKELLLKIYKQDKDAEINFETPSEKDFVFFNDMAKVGAILKYNIETLFLVLDKNPEVKEPARTLKQLFLFMDTAYRCYELSKHMKTVEDFTNVKEGDISCYLHPTTKYFKAELVVKAELKELFLRVNKVRENHLKLNLDNPNKEELEYFNDMVSLGRYIINGGLLDFYDVLVKNEGILSTAYGDIEGLFLFIRVAQHCYDITTRYNSLEDFKKDNPHHPVPI